MLSFKKRLTIIVRRIEKIAIFTNEANLIVVDVISTKIIAKMKLFMNQIDVFDNIMNLHYSYHHKYVINDDFIIVDSSFFFSFDKYIFIIEIINEKSDNDLFSDEEWYEQLIWKNKLNENLKKNDEKNWTNENEEKKKNKNEEKKKDENELKKKMIRKTLKKLRLD